MLHVFIGNLMFYLIFLKNIVKMFLVIKYFNDHKQSQTIQQFAVPDFYVFRDI